MASTSTRTMTTSSSVTAMGTPTIMTTSASSSPPPARAPSRTSKRAAVPILLESFPVPPSHIPPSPNTPTTPSITSPNPPPSRPPSLPLPSVPGPSRISDPDILLFKLSPNRSSRRLSRGSGSASPAGEFGEHNRDSILSTASAGSISGRSPGGSMRSTNGGRDSVASSRSGRSMPPSRTASGFFAEGRPSIAFSIEEEEVVGERIALGRAAQGKRREEEDTMHLGVEQLTRMSISPMPLSDIEDNYESSVPPQLARSPSNMSRSPLRLGLGRRSGPSTGISTTPQRRTTPNTQPSSPRSPYTSRDHRANESISSIDMRDLPVDDFLYSDKEDEGEEDGDVPTTTGSGITATAAVSPFRHRPRGSGSGSGSGSINTTSQKMPPSTILWGSPPSTANHSSSGLSPPLHPRMRQVSLADPIDPHILGRPAQAHQRLAPIRGNDEETPSTLTATHGKNTARTGTTATDILSHPAVSTIATSADVSSSRVGRAPPSHPPPTAPIPSLPMSPPVSPLPPLDAQALHLQMRAARSRSASHKMALRARSTSPGRAKAAMGEGAVEAVPPVPGSGTGTPDTPVFNKAEVVVPARATTPPAVKSPSPDVTPFAPSRIMKVFEADGLSKSSGLAGPFLEDKTRSTSPDIDTIISATPRPRPRRKSSGAQLSSSASRSRSQSRPRSRVTSTASVPPTVSVHGPSASGNLAGIGANGKRRVSAPTVRGSVFSRSSISTGAGDDDLAYIARGSWRSSSTEEEEECGVPARRGQFDSGFVGGEGYGEEEYYADEVEEDYDENLERELEGAGSGAESDSSSIDLHTPLPHLLLRHGLLSPNSKLLTQSRANTPLVGADGRPGSTMSIMSTAASMMTKSGLLKDERDTPMRRTRHRDGRLLKGGIGLTTGLGWSDSEDEDAPSPLTRRISKLNISRRSSSSSMVSTPATGSRPHPLSRSSNNSLLSGEFDNSAFETSTSTGRPVSKTPRSSLPPTSWQKRNTGGSGVRSSTSSVGSTLSIDVNRRQEGSAVSTRTSSSSSRRHGAEDVALLTPSSASTLSIPLPITPSDDSSVSSPTSNAGLMPLDKEKSLPPLPAPSLRKYPSNVSLNGAKSFPRARTFSSTSSASSSGIPTSSSTTTTITNPASATAIPNVRPLRLTQQTTVRTGDRPAVPVPSISSYKSVRAPTPSSSRSAAGLSSPPPPNSAPPASMLPVTPTGILKPRPRTGTGMVYRTSSGGLGSRMRAPMQMQLSTSLSASTSGLSPPAVRSAPAGVPRAIAL